MAFACEKSNNKTYYIGEEDLPEKLICLDCKSPVHAKKGKERQHHFAHLPNDISCKLTEESALHLNSKLFLHKCLCGDNNINLNLPVEAVQDCFVKETFRRIGLHVIPISISDVINLVMPTHVIEKQTVDKFTPDVSTLHGDNVIAWEIYVTSRLDGEKLQYYSDQEIPFVELIPKVDENANKLSYNYTICNYGNIDLIPEKINFLLNQQFSECAGATIDFTIKNLQDIIFSKMKFCRKINKISTYNLLPVLSEFMSKNGQLEISQTYKISDYIDFKEEPLRDHGPKSGKYGPSVCINDKYFGSLTNFVAELIQNLCLNFGALVCIGENNKFLGLYFVVFDSAFNTHKIRILLSNETCNLFVNIDKVEFIHEHSHNALKLVSTKSIYSHETKEYNDAFAFFNDYAFFIIEFLKSVSVIPNVSITLQTAFNTKRQQKIIGMKVNGIFPMHRLEHSVIRETADYFSRLAASTESPNIKIEKAQ